MGCNIGSVDQAQKNARFSGINLEPKTQRSGTASQPYYLITYMMFNQCLRTNQVVDKRGISLLPLPPAYF